MIYDYLRLVIKRSLKCETFLSRITSGEINSHKSVEDERTKFEMMEAVRYLPQILDNCERAAEWRLKWNRPVGAQKCANDVQTSLEHAFPHCVRVFKARKKALRNMARRTKRSLAE